MQNTPIGILGGSGLYQIEGLSERQEHDLVTPFGLPSDRLISGKLAGVPVVFLARHGQTHHLLPSEVPYRANIYAFKQLGVKHLLSFSAVGSLSEDIAPLDMVIPDQYVDMTRQRINTFFGQGSVAHVSLADPICADLAQVLADAAEGCLTQQGLKLHVGGTYLCIEGPQFSTRAESHWFRSLGANIIGMTNMPEARLAREAQMAYASLGMVTDYDAWHPREQAVTADYAIKNLMKNSENAQQILMAVLTRLQDRRPESLAHTALRQGLVTPLNSMSVDTREWVEVLLQ
jgi:5'-methylthioadenosine phosphorylase